MRFLLLIFFLTAITSSRASVPQPPVPLVTVSASGQCFFTLLPQQWDEHGEITRQPSGRAYEVQNNGEFRELWRVEKLYALKVFLSRDARYLVVVNDWFGNRTAAKKFPAIAFYFYGKLLRQFFTADLVKDETKVRTSVGLYQWVFRQVVSRDLEDSEAVANALRYSDEEKTLWLTTADGISYTFDATKGEITATKILSASELKAMRPALDEADEDRN